MKLNRENVIVKKMRDNLKNEKGSITLFVLIAMLFFVVSLFSIYVSNNNRIQTLESEIEKIEENYSYSDEDIMEIYRQIISRRN